MANPSETNEIVPPDKASESPAANRRLVIMVALGIVILLLSASLYLYFSGNGDGSGVSDGDETNTVFVFPIWLAIVPLLFASKRKDGDNVPESKQKLLVIVTVGVVLLGLAGLVLLLINR